MKTQGKNQVLSILGEKPVNATMMCSFRCDRELWTDFGIYCSLKNVDRTEIIISHVAEIVNAHRAQIEAAKRRK